MDGDDVPAGSLMEGDDAHAFYISLEGIAVQPVAHLAGTTAQSTPRPRYNHTAVRVGNRIHFYGGWARGRPLADHLCLELARGPDVPIGTVDAEAWRRRTDPWMSAPRLFPSAPRDSDDEDFFQGLGFGANPPPGLRRMLLALLAGRAARG
jgi:hypothetical protein